jgi:very-short-patch-repair endonuclease
MSGRERWKISPELKAKMHKLAAELRKEHTASEAILWQFLRNRQLEGRKFRRQNPIGAFVVDFYCPDEHLVIEVDGQVHEDQYEADALRQEIIESLGVRFIRVTAAQVERDLTSVLTLIRSAFKDNNNT